MAKEVNTIGVLTSGGDAPGMNAAIRAVVRQACANGKKVKGIRRGYQGLLEEEIIDMEQRICQRYRRAEAVLSYIRPDAQSSVQKMVREKVRRSARNMELMVWSSSVETVPLQAHRSWQHLAINTIGVPGTIDLDIACTEYTIGFDTAVNTAMEAIDKVRDTSTSHERCSIIEVMGRRCRIHCTVVRYCQRCRGYSAPGTI